MLAGLGGEPCEAVTRGKKSAHHVLAPAGRLRRSVFSASRQLAAAAPCTGRPQAGHSTPLSRHDAEEEGPRGRNPQRLHLERVWRLFQLGLRCRRSVWTCRLACARTRARSRVLCKRVMATGGVSSSQRSSPARVALSRCRASRAYVGSYDAAGEAHVGEKGRELPHRRRHSQHLQPIRPVSIPGYEVLAFPVCVHASVLLG